MMTTNFPKRPDQLPMMDSCVKALEPPKHRPLNRAAIEELRKATFALETIAHLCGWEGELLGVVQRLKRLLSVARAQYRKENEDER